MYEDGEDQLQKLIDELSTEAEEKDTQEKEQEEVQEIDRCDNILERLTHMHLAASGQAPPKPEKRNRKE